MEDYKELYTIVCALHELRKDYIRIYCTKAGKYNVTEEDKEFIEYYNMLIEKYEQKMNSNSPEKDIYSIIQTKTK